MKPIVRVACWLLHSGFMPKVHKFGNLVPLADFAPNVIHMVFVRFRGTTQALHFNPTHHIRHLPLVQNPFPVLIDESEQLIQQNCVWPKVSSQFGAAGEHHHTDECAFRQFKQRLHRFNVAVVLKQRILEPVFYPVNYLCPFGITGIAENPARIVFCFDDEYPAFRYENVVNLRGSIFRWQGDIVDQHMETVQLVQRVRHERLAHVPLEQQMSARRCPDGQANKKAQDANHCQTLPKANVTFHCQSSLSIVSIEFDVPIRNFF